MIREVINADFQTETYLGRRLISARRFNMPNPVNFRLGLGNYAKPVPDLFFRQVVSGVSAWVKIPMHKPNQVGPSLKRRDVAREPRPKQVIRSRMRVNAQPILNGLNVRTFFTRIIVPASITGRNRGELRQI